MGRAQGKPRERFPRSRTRLHADRARQHAPQELVQKKPPQSRVPARAGNAPATPAEIRLPSSAAPTPPCSSPAQGMERSTRRASPAAAGARPGRAARRGEARVTPRRSGSSLLVRTWKHVARLVVTRLFTHTHWRGLEHRGPIFAHLARSHIPFAAEKLLHVLARRARQSCRRSPRAPSTIGSGYRARPGGRLDPPQPALRFEGATTTFAAVRSSAPIPGRFSRAALAA